MTSPMTKTRINSNEGICSFIKPLTISSFHIQAAIILLIKRRQIEYLTLIVKILNKICFFSINRYKAYRDDRLFYAIMFTRVYFYMLKRYPAL